MPLSFFYHDIANFEELLKDLPKGSGTYRWTDKKGKEHVIRDKTPDLMLETLILMMPVLGMQAITKDNVGEVWARIDLFERINGPLRYGPVIYFEGADKLIEDHKARPTTRLKNMLNAAYSEGVRVNSEGGMSRRDVTFKMEDITRCIGLKVDVANTTRANFIKRVVAAHMDEQSKRCTDAYNIASVAALGQRLAAATA